MLPLKFFLAVPLLITATALPLERSREEEEGLRGAEGSMQDLLGPDLTKGIPGLAKSQHADEGGQATLKGDPDLRGIWNEPATSEQKYEDRKWRGNVHQAIWRNKALWAREISPAEDLPEEPVNSSQDDQSSRTPERKAATSELDRQKNRQRTPEEKAAAAENMRRIKSQWTPEQRAAAAETVRQAHARQTPEQKLATAEKKRQAMLNRTPEQKAASAQRRAQTNAQKSPEEKAARAQRIREGVLNKSAEEKAARKAKIRQKLAQKTPEEKAALSEKLINVHAQRSPEKKAEIARKIAESERKAWEARTPEEKAASQAKRRSTQEKIKRLKEEAAKLQEIGKVAEDPNDVTEADYEAAEDSRSNRGTGEWNPAAGEAWKENLSRFFHPFVEDSRSVDHVRVGPPFSVTSDIRVPVF